MPDSPAPGPDHTPSPVEPRSAADASVEPGTPADLDTGTDQAPRKRRTRNLVVTGVTAGVLALGGVGAYAFATLSGGGAQPHDVLPASALAYGRVDLDPSAGQKIEILRLLQKFPDLKDTIGDENADLRELFIENALGEDCDVDFAADVEPWLGQRVGVALLSEPLEPVAAIQVDDEDKARTGITQLTECTGEDGSAIAFLDGYAIVGSEQKTVDAAVADAEKAALGEKAEFTQALETIGDQGVASAWLDYGALASHPEIGDLLAEGAGLVVGQPAVALPETLGDLGAATVVVRAESSAIEVRGTFEGSGSLSGEAAVDAAQLPDSTVLAAGAVASDEYRDVSSSVFTDQLSAAGIDEQMAAELEATLGVSIEELTTLITSNPLLTVGERGLDDLGGFTGPESVGDLDVALRTHGDAAELRDINERLAAAAAMLGGVELTVEDVEGGVALATAPSALEAGSGLASSEAFRSVVPFDTLTSLVYLDFDKLQPVVEQLAAGDEAVIENLAPLRAFGASASGDEFSMRLSFDD
jgi:hypothetical protein